MNLQEQWYSLKTDRTFQVHEVRAAAFRERHKSTHRTKRRVSMKTTKIIVAVAATTLATAAFAGPVNVDYTGTGAGSNVRITVGSTSSNVFAGQLKHTLSGADAVWNGNYRTYCTDLTQTVVSGIDSFNIVELTAMPDSSPMGTAKANAIKDMFAYTTNSVTTSSASNDLATAFQLAVWEVIKDFNSASANNGLSITSGSFSAKKTDGTALSSGVTTILNNLLAVAGTGTYNNTTGIEIKGISNECYQDQIITRVVPAPGMAGLGLIGGLAMARRRSR
jgi:hypothetical protein